MNMPPPSPPPRLLPKEHGTWAMLLVPWAVGCGVAGRVGGRELLLVVAAVSFFLSHTHLMTWYRLRLAARPDASASAAAGRLVLGFGALGVAAAAPLLALGPVAALLPLALIAGVLSAVSLRLVARRADHTLPGQVLAAVGLSLSAPAGYSVAGGGQERAAFALWLLNAAFFLWAVLYVRLKIEARGRRAPPASAMVKLAFARGTLALDLVILAVAVAAIRLGSFSTLGLAAFAPAALQTGAGIARLDRPAALKRIGILVTIHSILFAILLIGLV